MYLVFTNYLLNNLLFLRTLLIIAGFALTINTVSASELSEGESWYLGHGNPDVYITIVDSKINAQAWSNIPATQLQTINNYLWKEYKKDYIVIKDYNSDGYLDVGVMKGSGYGGNDICYAIYKYDPVVYSYHSKTSITVCD